MIRNLSSSTRTVLKNINSNNFDFERTFTDHTYIIELMLMGIDPNFVIITNGYDNEKDRYRLLNRDVRLEFFIQFLNNEVELNNCNIFTELTSKRFCDIEFKYQRRIWNFSVDVIYIDKPEEYSEEQLEFIKNQKSIYF